MTSLLLGGLLLGWFLARGLHSSWSTVLGFSFLVTLFVAAAELS